MLCTQSGLGGGEAELAYKTEPLHRCSGRRAIHRVSRLMGERTECDVRAASLREAGRRADVHPAALAWQRRRRAAGWPGEAQTKPSVIRSHCGMKGTRLRLLENLHQAEKLNERIHRLKDALRSPPPAACFYTYVHGYLGCSDFPVALVRKSLAPVQFSPAVEAALFEVFRRCFVHPLLQQRELEGEKAEKRNW